VRVRRSQCERARLLPLFFFMVGCLIVWPCGNASSDCLASYKANRPAISEVIAYRLRRFIDEAEQSDPEDCYNFWRDNCENLDQNEDVHLLKFNFAQQQFQAVTFGEEGDGDRAIIPADAPPHQQIVLHANQIGNFGFGVAQEPPPPLDACQEEINLIKNLMVIWPWEGRGLCCMFINGGACCSGRTVDEIVVKLMRNIQTMHGETSITVDGQLHDKKTKNKNKIWLKRWALSF
jgi:hypothetical protein